jgi:hypothetical protein
MARRRVADGDYPVATKMAMELTGHKSPSVFDRYDIVDEGDLAAAADRLNPLMGTFWGQSPRLGTPPRPSPRENKHKIQPTGP